MKIFDKNKSKKVDNNTSPNETPIYKEFIKKFRRDAERDKSIILDGIEKCMMIPLELFDDNLMINLNSLSSKVLIDITANLLKETPNEINVVNINELTSNMSLPESILTLSMLSDDDKYKIAVTTLASKQEIPIIPSNLKDFCIKYINKNFVYIHTYPNYIKNRFTEHLILDKDSIIDSLIMRDLYTVESLNEVDDVFNEYMNEVAKVCDYWNEELRKKIGGE